MKADGIMKVSDPPGLGAAAGETYIILAVQVLAHGQSINLLSSSRYGYYGLDYDSDMYVMHSN